MVIMVLRLVFFFFLPVAQGLFQYISVTKHGGEVQNIGCLPAEFTWTPVANEQTSFKAVVADPEIACTPPQTPVEQVLNNIDEINGNTAIIRRSKDVVCSEDVSCCSFQEKTTVCETSGATGIIVINDNEDAILPITMGASHSSFTSTVPICMITYKDGVDLVSAVSAAEGSGGDVTIDFKNVFPDDLDLYPPVDQHTPLLMWTYMSVLTPWAIKFRHYAANVIWNPEIVTDEPIAAEVVRAHVEMNCPYAPNIGTEFTWQACIHKGCYAVRVTNPEEVAGKIAFIETRDIHSGDFVYCAHEDELAAVAQEAGAVGVLSTFTYNSLYHLPLYVSPRYRPYDFTIPMLIIRGINGKEFEDQWDLGEKIVVRFPPVDRNHVQLTNWTWPETYYPDVETYGALNFASVCLKEMGGETERECFEAGQAKFNPIQSPAIEAQLVMGIVDDSCHGNDADSDGLHDYGTDCDRCHQLLDDDLAILNPESLEGNIVMILANDTFCINEWEQLVDNVALHGAAGILIGNTGEFTLTLVDSQQDIVAVPVFNVPKSRAEDIKHQLMMKNLGLTGLSEDRGGHCRAREHDVAPG
ncbi:hypothetical protein TrCOL_g10022 [Triparma columacea]|uniref:PA domain-containing protein n=1 Tax=Triparma columacea TaxID=722753 RepID=A0A9W7GBI4_9STRA|nr:hypothetical protein TrCOL_g10022 [Triparma columacea]